LPAFENDLWRDTRAIAGSDRIFAKTVAVTQKEKWLVAKFTERDAAVSREPMIFWESRKERLGD
jgi:hypothetical protein